MQRVVLDGVEPGSVVRAVDARTYARGVLFAQRRAVAEMEWDGEHNALYTPRCTTAGPFTRRSRTSVSDGHGWTSSSASARARPA